MKIRIATRKSELALFQANLVAEKLIEQNNSLKIELVPMSSDGDETDTPLHQIGGKGLFINTLESAILKDKALSLRMADSRVFIKRPLPPI